MGVAAELIRGARRSAGLTASELASRAGVSKPSISRYERGVVDPGSEMLDRLLRACGSRLRSTPLGLPSSAAEVAQVFRANPGPTDDDLTRTSDGRAISTAEDLKAFVAELHGQGLLKS